jgi:hypothetical protein
MMQLDHELRARFGELRDADGAGAPDVSGVVARTPIDRRATIARRSGAMLLAVAAVVLIGVVVARRPRAVDGSSVSITNWKSPTTILIPTTRQSMLAPDPLLSSVLDGATASTLWHKGD